jgi:peptide deformylase
MAVREILLYPHPTLRKAAQPVERVDDEIRELIEDMAETMYAAPGVGLAANQIGVLKRVFVIDTATDDEPSQLRAFVNPEIIEESGTQTWSEGCLSFPGASEDIKRAERVVVRALDAEGQPFELEAHGLLAVAIQHENDHLNGVLMIDKLNALKRRLLSSKLAKRAKAHSSPDSEQPRV